MDGPSPDSDRVAFLKLAFLFQGSLLLIAVFVGWFTGQPVWTKCRLSWEAVGWGVAATLPMLVFLRPTFQSRNKSFVQIRELLRDMLGRQLAACRWFDLVVIALLAGVSEECLFRGVLEPGLSGWGPLLGLAASNVIFGICHAVTPAYAVVAGLMGAYLSMTLWLTSEPNLLIPILCHSLYDFVAFIVVRRSCRQV